MTSSTFAVRGRLLFGTHLEPGTLVASEGRIERIVRGHLSDGNLPTNTLDADIVTPGLIDLQVNGADGVEVDENPRHIEHISRWSLPSGVTAWLPTIVTAAADSYPPVFAGFAEVDATIGATPLGLHLEGPFLAPARKGAHQLRYIENATDDIFQVWLTQNSIRLVTLAPEREGNLARIRTLVELGVTVSLGHTDATYEQFAAGIDAGATKATHLFNAMSPMHHRQPGAMIATLTDDRVTSGLIPDAVHSHPATVRLVYKAKGPDRIAIVSDMMSATGLGEGTYELGGQTVTVTGLAAQLADGTLAGSAITMDQAIRNVVEWADVPTGSAMHMATAVPARLLNDDSRGRLVEGARADLALWSRDLRVVGTVVAGEQVWAETPVS